MHGTTIVPASGCVAPDKLTVEVFEHVAKEVRATFSAFQLPPSIVGLEASFDEDVTGEVPPHWCVHAHSLGLDWLSNDQIEGLRAAFPHSRWARRPVHVDLLDHDVRARRYPFKPERVRRESYLNSSNPHREPYRDSKRRALRPWQAASLAIVEHQLGFGRRLMTHAINQEAVRQHLAGLGWPRDGP